jgi:Tol biopolymer transport system component
MKAQKLIVATQLLLAFSCATVLQAQERYPVRQLTTHPAQEGFPSWSPDGRTIVYFFNDQGDGAPVIGLWKVAADGGEPRRFTEFIGEHPDWSPDGRQIVFDADSGNSIKLISSQGGQPIRVVPESINVFLGGNPNWSPDGRRIAFKADSALWVLDVRTGEIEIVFKREGTYPIPGCWSADGDGIYATVRAAEPPTSAIWRLSTTGGAPRQLTFETDRRHRYMALSPDGTLLAFSSCEGRNCDLFVMPADGGGQVQLTFDPAYDDTPRWSPDGTKIAFTSTRSGSFDVWIIEPDIAGLRAALGPGADELSPELEFLRPFLGAWVGEFQDAGERPTVLRTWTPILDGQAIRETRTVPEAEFEAESIYYYDRAAGVVSYLSITDNGYVGRGQIAFDGELFTQSGEQTAPDSSTGSIRVTFRFTDQHTLVNQLYNLVDGEWQSSHTIIYRASGGD